MTDYLLTVPETHQFGHLSVENLELIRMMDLESCDVGLQTSADGRIWICVNGIAFLRFKPARVPAVPQPSTPRDFDLGENLRYRPVKLVPIPENEIEAW